MLELLTSPDAYLSLLTLTALEVVLGVDNVIFISILTAKLPPGQRERARRVGLLGALGTRILFLLMLSWLVGLTAPLFTVFGHAFTGQGLILLAGGLFLLWKATREIHDKLEGSDEGADEGRGAARFGVIVAQIMILDVVFSIDSVITAVGMSNQLAIMIAANVIALGVMLWAGAKVGAFVERHPTVKMLALSFLLLIGVFLVADAVGFHIPKGYLYFAMAFSVGVEFLNLRARRGRPLPLKNTPHPPAEG